ncbi:MAG: ribosome maturation factor RimP [Acidobacteriota bacterium]
MDAVDLDKIRETARGLVEFAGMEMVHLEMKRGPGGWVLRLFIDKEGGVTLDDCSRISRRLSAQLDVDDPIPHRYTLEVSSPGLERPLFSDRDFERFAGRMLRLSTREPLAGGRRNFRGRLLGLRDGVVHLALEGGEEIAVPREQVASARLELDETRLRASTGTRGRHA